MSVKEITNSNAEVAPPEDEKNQSGRTVLIKCLIAVGLCIFILMLPRPDNLPIEAHKLASILIPIVFLWVSEAIPIGITAFLATAFMIAFEVTSATAAWAPYANRAVMFVLMIMMFGIVLNEVGLTKRLLFLILKVAGTNVKKLSFFVAFSSTMLATIFHDATVTIIMLFAILPIFASMGITPKNSTNLSKFFIIMIPLSASAGGFGTMLGGGRVPLAVDITTDFLAKQGVVWDMGFLRYMIFEFPVSFFTAVATWAVVYLIFRPKEVELPASVRIEEMPPMDGREKGVLCVFVSAFVLWFAGDFTGWHVSVVAAFALFGFTAPGWVTFKAICDKFPWESWLVFGSGVSLGVAMLTTGLGLFVAQAFLPLLEGQNAFITYYGMGLFGSMLSSIMSNSAAVALSLPITLPMADMMNMSVPAVGMLAPMSTSFIMLVIGCPPTIIAYSTGFFSQVEFIKVAVPWCLTLLTVCTTAVLLYWPLLGLE